MSTPDKDVLLLEAAADIGRLRSELDNANRINLLLSSQVAERDAKVIAYTELVLSQRLLFLQNESERDALRARVESAEALCAERREALEPFATYAKLHGPIDLVGRNGANLNVSHWTNAWIALAKTPADMGAELKRLRTEREDANVRAAGLSGDVQVLRQQLAEEKANLDVMHDAIHGPGGYIELIAQKTQQLAERDAEIDAARRAWLGCKYAAIPTLEQAIGARIGDVETERDALRARVSDIRKDVHRQADRANKAEARNERLVAALAKVKPLLRPDDGAVGWASFKAREADLLIDAALADNGAPAEKSAVSSPQQQFRDWIFLEPAHLLRDGSEHTGGSIVIRHSSGTEGWDFGCLTQDGKVEIKATLEQLQAAYSSQPTSWWIPILIEIVKLRAELADKGGALYQAQADSARLEWLFNHASLFIKAGHRDPSDSGDWNWYSFHYQHGESMRGSLYSKIDAAMQAAKEGA